MFHTIDEFVKDWTQESSKTQAQMDQLTDKALGQTVVDGHRTLGRLAWHIIVTIPEMMQRTGLKLPAVDHSAPGSRKRTGPSRSSCSNRSRPTGKTVHCK
jgi:uncharacterized damage-inducible protein DinB